MNYSLDVLLTFVLIQPEKYILYTGEFSQIGKALKHPDMVTGIKEGWISDIYLDNTLAFAKVAYSMDMACQKIVAIIE